MRDQTLFKSLQEESVKEQYKTTLLELVVYLLRFAKGFELWNAASNECANSILSELEKETPNVTVNQLVNFLYLVVTQETKNVFDSYFNLDILRFLLVRSVQLEGIIDRAETISKRIACLHYIIRATMLMAATSDYK